MTPYSTKSEYLAAYQEVVIADCSTTGCIVATGPDSLDLINRLSTNQTDLLKPGDVVKTVFTNNKGRILDWVTLLNLDESVIMLTSRKAKDHILEWITNYTIVEEVTLQDITKETAHFRLMGPNASKVVTECFTISKEYLDSTHCFSFEHEGQTLSIAQTNPLGLPGYDLLASVHYAPALWNKLINVGSIHGIKALSSKTIESLRVEHSIPTYGKELSGTYNPLEAGLSDSISWNKGCYIGQEVIARLWTYKKIQKYLVQIAFENLVQVDPGSSLDSGGSRVGVVTSTADNPITGQTIGLAYIRSSYAQEGQEFSVSSGGESQHKGRVVKVPEMPTDQPTINALDPAYEELASEQ